MTRWILKDWVHHSVVNNIFLRRIPSCCKSIFGNPSCADDDALLYIYRQSSISFSQFSHIFRHFTKKDEHVNPFLCMSQIYMKTTWIRNPLCALICSLHGQRCVLKLAKSSKWPSVWHRFINLSFILLKTDYFHVAFFSQPPSYKVKNNESYRFFWVLNFTFSQRIARECEKTCIYLKLSTLDIHTHTWIPFSIKTHEKWWMKVVILKENSADVRERECEERCRKSLLILFHTRFVTMHNEFSIKAKGILLLLLFGGMYACV